MALIKCKECGKEISDKVDSCIHCGCPIKNNEKISKKTNVKIVYPATFGMVIPDIEVYFKNNIIAKVANKEEKDILVNEDGTLLFKGSFRKTKVEIEKDMNYTITLSWNRITGQLVAKVDSWE